MNRTIFTDRGLLPEDEMRRWESERLASVSRRFGSPARGAKALAEFKLALGRDAIMHRLKSGLAFGRVATKLMIILSRGRYRLCQVEIDMAGLSATQAADGIRGLMEDRSNAALLANLAACPDHHVFDFDRGVLEVVETTGGAPFPTQMFVRIGDEAGLPIEADALFPIQIAGIARMADGTVMGGVRHQFRDESGGFKVRLCVAFPRALPAPFIRAHQLHLACEFSNWFEHLLCSGRP